MATETRGLREPESRRIRGTHGRVVISESVVCAALDDEAVLLNVETGLYFGLDAIGSRIWELLAEGVAPDRICEQLYAEYEVSPAQLSADLADFLSLLIARGLAREGDS